MKLINSYSKSLIYPFLVFFVQSMLVAQVVETPPYDGDLYQAQQGLGLSRMGFVHRYPDFVYPPEVMNEWLKTRGQIRPDSMPGVISNPYRYDGTGLNTFIGIPPDFTGHVPVFTIGNNWPFIGWQQGDPKSYNELTTDTGPYYIDGKIVNTAEPITYQGVERVTIVNNTPYSYLVSAGMFPGNEQPGQVMTIVDSSATVQLPIPPRDWWTITNLNTGAPMPAVPEVYSSVAGLNPLDAPGWKHSSWSPKYKEGNQNWDFGTGGFAYTFGSLFGTGDLSDWFFAGFHTNEGYDPLVSGDPAYGCAFYVDDVLEAVMDILPFDSLRAQATIVAKDKNNPAQQISAFDPNVISHLNSIIGVPPGAKAELHYIFHNEAQNLISNYEGISGWTRVDKTYESNPHADVKQVPLPNVIPANNDTLISSNCFDNIQNGDETGVDCGGSCNNNCDDSLQACENFGISYINDSTARVYYKDLPFLTEPFDTKICMHQACFEPYYFNGYYYYDFNSATSFGFVSPILEENYWVEFKTLYSGGFYSSTELEMTFTKDRCILVQDSIVLSSFPQLDHHLAVYPNPVSAGNVFIVDGSPQGLYRLFNYTGRLIIQGIGNRVDTSLLKPGIYYLVVEYKSVVLIIQ